MTGLGSIYCKIIYTDWDSSFTRIKGSSASVCSLMAFYIGYGDKVQIVDIERLVEQKLSSKRFYHTKCVVEFAKKLAVQYNVSEDNVTLACMLHDITKEESLKLQLQKLQNSGIILSDEFVVSPALYHSKTGMLFARDVIGIDDNEILGAISYHTTGAKGMSMLQKIVYTADAVSADRKYKGVEDYRKLALNDINRCVLEIITYNIKDLLKKHFVIPIDTIECYNELALSIKTASTGH